MKDFKRIGGVNLLALFAYSLLARASGDVLLFSAVAVSLHVAVCILISIALFAGKKEKGAAQAWLLSSLVVLLVGFSVCLGNAAL